MAEAEAVNDAAIDFHGRTMATCSADGSIRISAIDNPSQATVILRGHQHPVWQVSWAHPRFGNILASCSFDGSVIVWRESGKQWLQVQKFEDHAESVNSIDWAPPELGLILATGSSDGTVRFFTAKQGNPAGQWEKSTIDKAHEVGVTGVSWAPAVPPASLVSPPGPEGSTKALVWKLASCGCDNTVKVWRLNAGMWKMDCFPPLSKHSDWVRDVAWAPNLGLPRTTMASGSQDGTVIIWTQATESDQWQGRLLNDFKSPVWRVKWSLTGNILAVTDGSGTVTLWKEFQDNEWREVHRDR